MKKAGLFIILGFLLSGCSVKWHLRQVEKKCPDCFKTETRIEYRDSIVYRDTIIELDINDYFELDTTPIIKYEKEIINNKIYLQPSFDTVIKGDRGLTAYIWLTKGRLTARFIVDSTLYYNYKDSILVLNKIIKERTIIKPDQDRLKILLYSLISFTLFFIVMVIYIRIKK